MRKMQQGEAGNEELTGEDMLSLMLPKLANPLKPLTTGSFELLHNQVATKDTQQALPQIRLLLEEVDMELERLSSLWANIELAFDMMLVKSDHLNHFIDYARNPMVMDRFRARMNDYEYFWNAMQRLTSSNIGRDDERGGDLVMLEARQGIAGVPPRTQVAPPQEPDFLQICAPTNTP
mmetsp:Transcript_46646/g.63515  ORF Transcript_46646/g.63515 Transcript_46646/m.63515 type:complete len:178 (-) Transcript_46646:165-698(-)